MAIAQVYIDGAAIDFMGNTEDSFLGYTNTVEAARSGNIFVSSEPKAKTLKIDDLKMEPDQFETLSNFLSNCGSKSFNITLSKNEDCGGSLQNAFTEDNYIKCYLTGEPSYSHFENKISGFEVAYQNKITRSGI
jgi:hypothetical protein